MNQMDTDRRSISLMDQIGPSIEHTKSILLAPFDLNRWLAIGFSAWLASLGEGGSGGNVNRDSGEANEVVNRSLDFLAANPIFMASLMILGIALVVLMIWLSSRGRFMFYHCVLYNSDRIVQPWHYYRHLASSLFRFRLWVTVIGAVYIMAVAGSAVHILGPTLNAVNIGALGPLVLLAPVLIVIPLGLLICGVLTNDFVIPIMHKHTLTCTAAWSRLWPLITAHTLNIFGYLLFKAVIAVALVTILFFLGMITCGCACCLASLPYLGTVLLLPVPTFKRSLSLHYLRQFGPDFDLFVSEPNPDEDQPESSPDSYSI